MNTEDIVLRLEKKAGEIRIESQKTDFKLKNKDLTDQAWTELELKKTERNYKISFGLQVFIIGLIVIVTLLKLMEILPVHSKSNGTLPVLILVLNTVAIVRTTCMYKIKIEKLRNALYLTDLKQEIEKLEVKN